MWTSPKINPQEKSKTFELHTTVKHIHTLNDLLGAWTGSTVQKPHCNKTTCDSAPKRL